MKQRSRMEIGLALTLCWLSICVGASAQSNNTLLTSTTGFTPPKMTPGSPDSSYELSGFDTINPMNGKLNFRLVLRTLEGRDGMKLPIVLPLQRNWQGQTLSIPHDCTITGYNPDGSPIIVCQWQLVYFAIDAWWYNADLPYSPGYVGLRGAGLGTMSTPDYTTLNYQNTNTQILR